MEELKSNKVGDQKAWELMNRIYYDNPERVVITEAMEIPNKNSVNGCLIKVTTILLPGEQYREDMVCNLEFIPSVKLSEIIDENGKKDGYLFINANTSTLRR